MKSYIKSYTVQIICFSSIFILLSSCSFFENLGNETYPENNEKVTISKREYQQLKQAKQESKQSELLQDLNDSYQTVDVAKDVDFATKDNTSNSLESNSFDLVKPPSLAYELDFITVNKSIERDVRNLQAVVSLLQKRDFDRAMSQLKPLENSQTRQVQTQAKFLLAESLFMQNEFDLAMQVYEELINFHAYSSLVLKSLGRLIACCEKLKLTRKKNSYYNLLNSFFETN